MQRSDLDPDRPHGLDDLIAERPWKLSWANVCRVREYVGVGDVWLTPCGNAYYSGATHKLGERRAAKLKRELAVGRGGKEVVSLMENGYAEFLGPEGEDLPLKELRAQPIK